MANILLLMRFGVGITLLVLGVAQYGYSDVKTRGVASMTFLLAVNDTWQDCIATVKTPPLIPGVKSNTSINVNGCDNGPLEFNVTTQKDKNGSKYMAVNLLFHSSVIEDASPPTCTIKWNGTYSVPGNATLGASQSLLPGCFVMDSREGYHMTYFWFYIFDWRWR